MTRHIIRRLIQAIPTLFGVTLLSFIIMSAAPGGPLTFLAFSDPQNMPPEEVQRLERLYGLDAPWFVQYARWLLGTDIIPIPGMEEATQNTEETTATRGPRGANSTSASDIRGCSIQITERKGILRGDFGCSYRLRRPVLDVIGERLPASMELGIATLFVTLILGVPIGLVAAIKRGGWFDNFTRIFAVVGNAVPSFWMGLMLLLIFSFSMGLFPTGGRCPRTREGCSVIPVYQRLEYMVLPVFVLSLGGIAGYSRYMRTSMLETINSDYVRTARAKGLPSRTVWIRHAARNALIPLATFLGPAIVGVIGGAAITEAIFSWPGLGQLFIGAVGDRDYPIIMASVVISAMLTIVAYIISDVMYALFDPRIRY